MLGAAIPFGRSLTYRFAFAGFWSAVAFAEAELTEPLNDLAVVKGLISRHFRWWSTKSDIFNVDGTLTIGYTYPNMYMCEDYNSPQSPYWAMKSFVVLGLSSKHPFWAVDEKVLPKEKLQLSTIVKPPMQIVCHTPNHHFLLSSGQFCPWPLKATEAKYGKFAYSSHFGLSVPTGTLIQQIAPDSTLALSKDDGDTWRVPWRVQNIKFGSVGMKRESQTLEKIPTIRSIWKPWKDADIAVHSLLIAPSQRWPDWHVRLHRLENKGTSDIQVRVVQGGFSIQGRQNRRGGVLPLLTNKSNMATGADFTHESELGFREGIQETQNAAVVYSNAGCSGIYSLKPDEGQVQSKGQVLKPDSNTNLVWQRTLIPTVDSTATISAGASTTLQSAIFSVARREGLESEYDNMLIEDRWADVPRTHSSNLIKGPESDCILIPQDW